MKKIIIIILIITGSVQLFSAVCGDVNSDNEANIVDALLIAQYYVRLNPKDFNSDVADVSGDSSIDIVDALLIAQYYVGLITSFPGCLNNTAPVSIRVFDRILFYDGYASTVNAPVPSGVIRHRNSLYSKELTTREIQLIQNTLEIEVLIGAACDNYDRIGNLNLAMVPRESSWYNPDNVPKIEIARFITPFMDKNKRPDTIPYHFQSDNLVPILKDQNLRAKYNFYLELELFGVPYAANKEIAGCDGRSDVFYGTVTLNSNSTKQPETYNLLLPLAIKEEFNNYASGASDKRGETKKTINFRLDSNVTHAQMVLITSNHGANSGGEEYTRRNHYVYFDSSLKLVYKPGRQSCEPFRQYNTQANGIYGSRPRTDAEWQSFSNWCPGDVIDIRSIELGDLRAGDHRFVIEVPDAVFTGQEGNIPLSLYFQAIAQ